MGKKSLRDVPVLVNEEREVVIEDIGSTGEGIGRMEGYAIFVKGALPGETVRVKVRKVGKNYGVASLEEVLAPSKDRVEPECKLAGRCGGCQLPHMDYGAQLRYKERRVKDCLERIGGLDGVSVEPIIGMENPYRYRNKAAYPVGRGGDGSAAIGFYASRSHVIVEGEDCLLQAECNRDVLRVVREFMRENGIKPYEEESHRGLVRHVYTRVGERTGDVAVCIVVNGEKLPKWENLVEMLVPLKVTGVCLNVNRLRTNVILGEKVVSLWGRPYIEDYIGSMKYRVSPLSFYQVNPTQTEHLYEVVLEFAGLTGKETVWDLYCGIGTIGLYLAKHAKMVYGVEVVPQAVEDARVNAKMNGIRNAEFLLGAVEDVVAARHWGSGEVDGGGDEEGGKGEGDGRDGAEKRDGQADVVVLDPPRKGCEKSVLDAVAAMGAQRVVYVSCDPATLARDLKYLTEQGYGVDRVRPTDLFPFTGHVETCVLLSHKKPDGYINVKVEFGESEGEVPLGAIV